MEDVAVDRVNKNLIFLFEEKRTYFSFFPSLKFVEIFQKLLVKY